MIRFRIPPFPSSRAPERKTPSRPPAIGPWLGAAVVIIVVVLVLAAVLAALGMPPAVVLSLLGSAGAIGVTIAISLRAAMTSRTVTVQVS